MDRLTTAGAPAWLGGSFIAIGVLIMLIAGGVIPLDPEAIKAPRWMLGAAGGVFAVAGARSMTANSEGGLRQLLGVLMMSLLVAMCVWAAFGPNDPVATVGTSVGPIAAVAPAPPLVGRVLFGAGAVALALALCVMFYRYFVGPRQTR